MNVGQVVNYRRQGVLLVAFHERQSQWEPVLMRSTAAAAGTVHMCTAAGINKDKPKCVAIYNTYMGALTLVIERSTMCLSNAPRNDIGKKIFFNMLDMALLNSFELYKTNTDARQSKPRHDYMCCVLWVSVLLRTPPCQSCHLQCPRLGATYWSTCQANGAGLCCLLGSHERYPQAELLLVPRLWWWHSPTMLPQDGP